MRLQKAWIAASVVLTADIIYGSEPQLIPTSPQVPPAALIRPADSARSLAVVGGQKIHLPRTERRLTPTSATQSPSSKDAAWNTATPHLAAEEAPAVQSIVPGSPIKRWLFFCPTTGKALPWLRPQPFVGPITGTFSCTSGSLLPGPADCCNETGKKGQAGPRRLLGPVRPLPLSDSGTAARNTSESTPAHSYTNAAPPNIFDRLLLPAQSTPYTPAARGFWNTPVPQGHRESSNRTNQ
ncbi:MAG: hypothetical protein NZU63_11775 [Gemmataceae bacterium]|nr:hypothetical protein [Gemmataceae bacterium]MDW8243274.1 hypothetical protein [Thermogemmata sp.]